MAGDGSDQRALQYEQTLVSLTCCRSELCSLATKYEQSPCMEPDSTDKSFNLTLPVLLAGFTQLVHDSKQWERIVQKKEKKTL